MRKIIPLLFALLIPCCYAQTNMGPINTPQVNSTLYVGSLSGSQFYPTIQSAVTSACASGKTLWSSAMSLGAMKPRPSQGIVSPA